ncbi:cornifelin homolog A-like [Biomphalaria glabrata]|uniref:Cornifelin homolog A-like n=1 Tax=Biomphalaria glabrata TaxID=6526 RepID=A0A9W2ZBF7_BIOGL|nr:cornifelin homolog A-like [Biomphalaria glabrata]
MSDTDKNKKQKPEAPPAPAATIQPSATDVISQQPHQAASWPQHQQPFWQSPQNLVAPSTQQIHSNTNVVINAQPGANKRPWSTGICDCCTDMNTCMLAWFCPFCLQFMIARDLGESCCDAFCYMICAAPTLFGLRVYVRGKENIKGSLFDDFNKTSLCGCLALAQLAREVKLVKSTKGFV